MPIQLSQLNNAKADMIVKFCPDNAVNLTFLSKALLCFFHIHDGDNRFARW